MEKHYFSFGQDHVHRHSDTTLDCDSILQINAPNGRAARDKMIDTFGSKWGAHYTDTESSINLKFFPRGVVLVLTCEVIPEEK